MIHKYQRWHHQESKEVQSSGDGALFRIEDDEYFHNSGYQDKQLHDDEGGLHEEFIDLAIVSIGFT